jgi:hypothetical protein
MTTPPPAPPAPQYQPAAAVKPQSSGTLSLVFGIILLFIALFPAIGTLSRFLLAALRADAYMFGQATAFLFFTAVFLVPGLLLIRRSNRKRRESRAAIEAQIYALEHEFDDYPPAPGAPAAPIAVQPQAQSAYPAPPAPPAPTQGPPAVPPTGPPAPPAPPIPPFAPPA